jgi:predicted MFS family arabinose efflux permease
VSQVAILLILRHGADFTSLATIYQDLGFNTSDALRLNLIFGALGFVFAIFWVLLLDRLARKTVLIGSTVMMAAALLVQAVLSGVYAKATVTNNNALNAQIAMFYVFNLFSVALG